MDGDFVEGAGESVCWLREDDRVFGNRELKIISRASS